MTFCRRFAIATLPSLGATVTAVLLVLATPSALAGEGGAPAGYWEGSVTLPAGELPVVVELAAGEDGTWSGTIDIPVQGIRGLALEEVRVDGDAVLFKLPDMPGNPVFNGNLAEDGATIAGNYVQGQQIFPFRLENKPAPANRDDPRALYAAYEAPGVPGEGLEGSWRALLVAGPARLRLVLNVARADDGTLTAALDSLDQGHTGLPVASIALDPGDRSVQFTMPAVGAGYNGTLSDDGSRIDGQWSQGPAALPLVFKRAGE